MTSQPIVRVGLVGLGWFGRVHAETWLGLAGVDLVAVCDRDSERLKPARGRDAQSAFHVETAHPPFALPDAVVRTTEITDLLSMDLDVVDVVVPESAHADVVRQALLAGLDVIVEKPLALTAAEVCQLLATAQLQRRNLYVGHILRFDVRNATTASMVESKMLRHMSFQRNFQTSAHDVYGRVHPALAAIVHDIDLAVWYAGQRPESVSAFASGYLDASNPDVLDVILHWPGGLRAVIQNSWHLPAGCPFGFEFECKVQTSGATYIVRNEPDLQIWREDRSESPEMHFWPLVQGLRSGALRAELDHFADCVRRGVPSTRVPLEQVLWSAEIGEAVLTSVADPRQGPVRL
ncbi:Gfo/Idh/MocA family protein [Nocardia amamiensis]|uniref:Gfo/Idh/MocA family protein n=1 Tax=Nocardia amamiensis TaxID=404578 RepID=UPI00082C1231|nr:Gfo/Idh/MocA family oxidoreductase [Nocardia amamiensis]